MTTETAETPAVRSGDAYTGSPVGCFHYSKIVREECRVARMKQRVSELWPSELLLMPGGTPNAGGAGGGEDACDNTCRCTLYGSMSVAKKHVCSRG